MSAEKRATLESQFIDWAADFCQLPCGIIRERMNDPRQSVNRLWCAWSAGVVALAKSQVKQKADVR